VNVNVNILLSLMVVVVAVGNNLMHIKTISSPVQNQTGKIIIHCSVSE